MSLYSVYYIKSDLNNFQNVSPSDETSPKLPSGYTFNDHIWANLYNTVTKNKIGYIIVNSYYVNVNENLEADHEEHEEEGGYVIDNAILFIESELPLGSINYLYNFYTRTNDTLIPSGDNNNCSVFALTGQYYNKEIAIKIDVSSSETRTVVFFVK